VTTQAVAQVDELVGHYRRLLGQWHRRVLWMDWTHPAVQEPPGGFCCGWAAFTAVAKEATLQPNQEGHRQSRFHVPLSEKTSNGTFTIPAVSHMSTSSEVGLTLSTIGMLIVAARRSVRQLIAAKVVPLDITPHHYWMLRIISKGAPMSLGELARAMWMDAPTPRPR